MVNRFEMEVDTTHANDVWQREVAANLAAPPAQTHLWAEKVE